MQEIRAARNTFAPFPVAIVDRRLCWGSSIHTRQAEKWSQVGHYDWRSYVDLDQYSEALIDKIKELANIEDSILDICCNVGRNLNALSMSGFSHLYGVDIMEEAVRMAPKVFPALENASLSAGNATTYLENLSTQSIDWAITQSATVELLHPSFAIHRELRRVLRKGLIFVINERGHAYPRYWRLLFKRVGFREISRTQLSGDLSLLTYVVATE